LNISNKSFHLFFDDGGVLNDNKARGPKWQKLIGEWFSPKYGGDEQKWGEANIAVIERETRTIDDIINNQEEIDYSMVKRELDQAWLEGMFRYMSIDFPQKSEYDKILAEIIGFIAPKAIAPYPGIISVIYEIYKKYGSLNTASNESSDMLKLYLSGMGLLSCFSNLYGPDLVNTFKSSPTYFNRIFEQLGIEPSQVIIIEDRPTVINYINQIGAIPIQSRFSKDFDPVTQYVVGSPKQLLNTLEEITSNSL
jgi:FMN phosphatase YigB (HAD superfamily)